MLYSPGMAIPSGLVKITLHGTLVGGEIWETGFWIAGAAGLTAGDMNQLARDVDTAVSKSTAPAGGIFTIAGHFWSGATAYTGVKAYAYSGGAQASAIGAFDRVAPLTGVGATKAPDQVAIVLTLRTNLAGRSHRGRMYLPCTGPSYEADGQLAKSETDLVTTAWSSTFSALAVPAGRRVVVLSKVLGSTQDVSAVTMDTRMDIQRRRANRQVATAVSRSTVVV